MGWVFTPFFYMRPVTLKAAMALSEMGMPEPCPQVVTEKTEIFLTWAEVMDWLLEYKHIFIELHPGFTFSLRERIGFTYTISKACDHITQMWFDRVESDKGFFASFHTAMEDAIMKILEMESNDKKE